MEKEEIELNESQLCRKCGQPHYLQMDDAGSDREVDRTCEKCFIPILEEDRDIQNRIVYKLIQFLDNESLTPLIVSSNIIYLFRESGYAISTSPNKSPAGVDEAAYNYELYRRDGVVTFKSDDNFKTWKQALNAGVKHSVNNSPVHVNVRVVNESGNQVFDDPLSEETESAKIESNDPAKEYADQNFPDIDDTEWKYTEEAVNIIVARAFKAGQEWHQEQAGKGKSLTERELADKFNKFKAKTLAVYERMEFSKDYVNGFTQGLADGFNLIDFDYATSQQGQGEWIPVTPETPTDKKIIGFNEIADEVFYGKAFIGGNGGWYIWIKNGTRQITHWMPLPTPPHK